MEVIGHAYLLKKGYFVMALCLSQTLSVMSGHSNRFLLDTSMPHSPERKKKRFFFPIIYDKVNYQPSRHIVVVMFGRPCICCLKSASIIVFVHSKDHRGPKFRYEHTSF